MTGTFDREFSKLKDATLERRLWRKIRVLEDRPMAGKALVGVEDPLFGRLYRLRVGDHRVVDAVQHEARRVILIRVGRRKTVYRGL